VIYLSEERELSAEENHALPREESLLFWHTSLHCQSNIPVLRSVALSQCLFANARDENDVHASMVFRINLTVKNIRPSNIV
jgi:hypothetical protein